MDMENLSLLSLVVVLLAASPLVVAAAWSESGVVVAWSEPKVRCDVWSSSRTYEANSTYEANLRHLAAVLPAETSASRAHSHGVDRAAGYWPNRVQARASCWSGGDGDCATCIAEAFKEVERACPFRREAFFLGRHCYLRLAEFRISFPRPSIDVFGRDTMVQTLAMGMIFQALGLACLFFLFIQAWRHDVKKGTMSWVALVVAVVGCFLAYLYNIR